MGCKSAPFLPCDVFARRNALFANSVPRLVSAGKAVSMKPSLPTGVLAPLPLPVLPLELTGRQKAASVQIEHVGRDSHATCWEICIAVSAFFCLRNKGKGELSLGRFVGDARANVDAGLVSWKER